MARDSNRPRGAATCGDRSPGFFSTLPAGDVTIRLGSTPASPRPGGSPRPPSGPGGGTGPKPGAPSQPKPPGRVDWPMRALIILSAAAIVITPPITVGLLFVAFYGIYLVIRR